MHVAASGNREIDMARTLSCKLTQDCRLLKYTDLLNDTCHFWSKTLKSLIMLLEQTKTVGNCLSFPEINKLQHQKVWEWGM